MLGSLALLETTREHTPSPRKPSASVTPSGAGLRSNFNLVALRCSIHEDQLPLRPSLFPSVLEAVQTMQFFFGKGVATRARALLGGDQAETSEHGSGGPSHRAGVHGHVVGGWMEAAAAGRPGQWPMPRDPDDVETSSRVHLAQGTPSAQLAPRWDERRKCFNFQQ